VLGLTPRESHQHNHSHRLGRSGHILLVCPQQHQQEEEQQQEQQQQKQRHPPSTAPPLAPQNRLNKEKQTKKTKQQLSSSSNITSSLAAPCAPSEICAGRWLPQVEVAVSLNTAPSPLVVDRVGSSSKRPRLLQVGRFFRLLASSRHPCLSRRRSRVSLMWPIRTWSSHKNRSTQETCKISSRRAFRCWPRLARSNWMPCTVPPTKRRQDTICPWTNRSNNRS